MGLFDLQLPFTVTDCKTALFRTWILRGWEIWNKIGERAYNQRS